MVRNLLENGLRQQKEKQDLVLDVENVSHVSFITIFFRSFVQVEQVLSHSLWSLQVEEALRISYGRKKQVEEQSRALAKNSFQFCKQNVRVNSY